MGIEVAALGVAIVGLAMQYEGQRKAQSAARHGRRVQEAQNASDAARERRQQIREARVRRAQILQSSTNAGTIGSSGEIGSVAALSTNLNSNIGTNLGRLQTAEQLSIFEQKAADAQYLSNIGHLTTSTASSLMK